MVSYKALNTVRKSPLSNSRHRVRYVDGYKGFAIPVFVSCFISTVYILNGRKVTVWILYRYEMAKI